MRKILLMAFIFTLFLNGCDLLQKEFMGRYGLKNCTFELTSVNADIYPDYSNLYKSYAIINLNIRVNNPNAYQVILDRMLFDLLINDRTVLKDVENNTRRDIGPGTSIDFGISVKVTYEEVNNAADGLFEGIRNGTVGYKLDATVFFDSEVTSFSYNTTIKEGKI
ncbi:MAG: hypothetical protein ACP5QK_03705 [Myxococcota bacterium]